MTPIIPDDLQYLLLGCNINITDYLVAGLRYGFGLHYQGPRCFRLSKNLLSALQNPVMVSNKLEKEIDAHRIAGPFVYPLLIEVLNIKKNTVNLGSYIIYLFLKKSINDHIPDTFCTVQYATLDDAVRIIVSHGKGCLLAKTDVESTFRVVPVRKEDPEL